MQVNVNYKNTLTFLIGLAFFYLGYLLWRVEDPFPEIDVQLKDIISYAVLAVEMGGHAVAVVHNDSRNSLNIQEKGETDEGKAELLTQADLISNHLILNILQRFPAIRVISEEKSGQISEAEAERYRTDRYSLWSSVREVVDQMPSKRMPLSRLAFWVDPLDATQEFTEGLLEYVTVMTCVTLDGKPIFGAIYRPFQNETVFGLVGWGAVKADGQVIKYDTSPANKKIVVSRSHAGKVEELAKIAFPGEYVVEPTGGSGYKSLRLANHSAELYMHTTKIKKWDTCAGDAIIRSLGGSMLDLDGRPIDYSPDLDVVNKRGLIAAISNPYSYYVKVKDHLKSIGL
ncbi:hypothetical protein L596_007089 [Steinernema carpocapsae]|uniref:inositol-phosphate phosphatase n=1 Tax=Steinernema carpocapsae TaxID=34508 RepID=A0A4U5P893_STECR|nr:hypothetical protein L596_007089 [Steinernema carpocapsae]